MAIVYQDEQIPSPKQMKRLRVDSEEMSDSDADVVCAVLTSNHLYFLTFDKESRIPNTLARSRPRKRKSEYLCIADLFSMLT